MTTTADPKPGSGGARREAGRRDAPRTIRELRLARAGKRKATPPKLDNPLREGLRLERVPDPACRRPVRGDRRPRPSQGRPGALPAVADEPAAPRVHARRRRPPAVRRRDLPGRDRAPRSSQYSRVPVEPTPSNGVPRPDRLPRGRLRRPGRVRPARRPARRRSTASTAPAATGCSTWRPSRRPSRRSSASSGGSASTTRSTAAAGAGSSSRSRSGATSTRRSGSTARSSRSSARSRSTGSTTTWARRPSATCWSSGSATGSSSRSGTGATSTMSRSRWPSRSGSRTAARSTRRPARSATSSRTT